jgi:hypothetical protein
MVKKIFTLLIIASLAFGVPFAGQARVAVEIIEQAFQEIVVSVSNSTLHVSGANGEVLSIYNLAGVKVQSFKVEGNDKRYELNLPKGCYIVKVGKVVRKISINR